MGNDETMKWLAGCTLQCRLIYPMEGSWGHGLNCVPLSICMLESYLPGPQNEAVFGDKGFPEVIKEK